MNPRASVVALVLLFPPGFDGLEGQQMEASQGVLVRGTVVDHQSEDPLEGAVVSLGPALSGRPGGGTRVSNDEGLVVFHGVPGGAYRISVALVGYHPMVDTVRVPADADLQLVLPLSVDPIRLEPIVVEGQPVRTGGFRDRAGAGSGPFLITRADIERRHPLRVTDLLASVPGVRVIRGARLQSVLLLRGDCIPSIILDGVRLPGLEGIDRLVSPGDVETIEVYHGTELPVQYGLNTCGGVVIRTRMGEAPPEGEGGDEEAESGVVRYVALAALVVVGIVVTLGLR